MNKIQKVVKVGDFVYLSANGNPTEIIRISNFGFYTKEDFFCWDEHRELYWLTQRAYLDNKLNKT